MARLPRLSIPGHPHLIGQRAHAGSAVLAHDADRLRYLGLLQAAASELGVAIHGYALLPDSAHLLATPTSSGAIGHLMQKVGLRYSRHWNERNGGFGTAWQGRYRATVVEAEHFLLDCLRYLESTPVQLGLTSRPEEWPWSSAAHHVGLIDNPLVTEHAMYWELGNTPFARHAAYRRLIEVTLPTERIALIDRAVRGGWALGGSSYVALLSKDIDRPLIPRRPGRKSETA